MTSRSVDSTVVFTKPFAIGGRADMLPAGSYNVTSEEELIEGLSFAAYRRISTTLEVPAIGTASATKQYLQVAADELQAALERDHLGARSGTE